MQKATAGVAKILGKISGSIKSQDAFGQPININYQGNETFQTLPGGVLSILMMVFFVGYTLLKTKYMINHEEWSLNSQNVMA